MGELPNRFQEQTRTRTTVGVWEVAYCSGRLAMASRRLVSCWRSREFVSSSKKIVGVGEED